MNEQTYPAGQVPALHGERQMALSRQTFPTQGPLLHPDPSSPAYPKQCASSDPPPQASPVFTEAQYRFSLALNQFAHFPELQTPSESQLAPPRAPLDLMQTPFGCPGKTAHFSPSPQSSLLTQTPHMGDVGAQTPTAVDATPAAFVP